MVGYSFDVLAAIILVDISYKYSTYCISQILHLAKTKDYIFSIVACIAPSSTMTANQ